MSARRDNQNRASRALRRELPESWKPSVYGEDYRDGSPAAAYGAADPGDRETDFVEVRHDEHQGGWVAGVGGYNERRGIGDHIEGAGPFDTPERAAKAAGDLVRKNFVCGVDRADRMRERNYGRSQPFGNQLDGGDFDFGGMF